MRFDYVAGLFAAVTLSLSTPAFAQNSLIHREDLNSRALKWEMAYLALAAVDTAQTISCIKAGECTEGNPLFGKHPSTKRVLLTKVGGSLIHFGLFSYINSRDPKAALRLAQISCGMQGGVVLLNARFSFR